MREQTLEFFHALKKAHEQLLLSVYLICKGQTHIQHSAYDFQCKSGETNLSIM